MVYNDQYLDMRLAEARNNLNLFFIQNNKYDSAAEDSSEMSNDESINMSTLSSSSSSASSSSSSDTSNVNGSLLLRSTVEDLSSSSSTNVSMCSTGQLIRKEVSRDLLCFFLLITVSFIQFIQFLIDFK